MDEGGPAGGAACAEVESASIVSVSTCIGWVTWVDGSVQREIAGSMKKEEVRTHDVYTLRRNESPKSASASPEAIVPMSVNAFVHTVKLRDPSGVVMTCMSVTSSGWIAKF